MMFRFIKTQYLLGKGEDYVINAFEKGLITEEEKNQILSEVVDDWWRPDKADKMFIDRIKKMLKYFICFE